MALSATFQADFSSFQTAVQQSEVALKGFEAGAGKVETSLNRMANSLQGTKLIQDATIMAEAVERVGGISRLTEKELAKVGATVSEAAAKMRAMGVDVPPGMQKIADATKAVDRSHVDLLGSVKGLVAGFAAMFTARAAFNFVNSTLNEASALKDLSQQTHIGVEELQYMAQAMSEFGVDADTLGKGLFNLSRRIAKGDDSVEAALQTMGMGLKDVQGLNGEALFMAIERGLSKLQGGLRDTTASELFGSRLGMAMAGSSEGIEGAMDAARRLNTVMQKESVDALDQYGEAIERMGRSMQGMAANMIGPLAQGFNTLNEAAEKGATKWQIAKAMYADYVASQVAGHSVGGNLATLLDSLNRKTEENTKQIKQNAGAQNDNAGAVGLTQKQLRELDKAMEDQAEAAAKNAKAVADMAEKVTKAEHDLYFDMKMFGIKQIKELTAEVEKEMARQRDAVEAAQMSILGLMNASSAKRRVEALGGAQSLDAQLEALAQTHHNKLLEIELLGRQASENGGTAWLEHARALAEEEQAAFGSAWDAIVQGSAAAGPAATGALNAIDRSASTAASSIASVANGIATLADSAEQVLRLAATNQANRGTPGMGLSFGTAESLNAMSAKKFGLTIPSFASGGQGDFGAGTLAMLHGRERIVPLDSAGGGSVNVVVNVNGSVLSNQDDLARAVGDAFVARLRSLGMKLPMVS